MYVTASAVNLSNGSSLRAETSGVGSGGDVLLWADTVNLSGFSSVSTQTLADGDGGDLLITADTLDLSDGSSVSSLTSGWGSGGDIAIDVASATFAASVVGAHNSGSGDRGNVYFQITNLLLLSNGARIFTAALLGLPGSPGLVGISAPGGSVVIFVRGIRRTIPRRAAGARRRHGGRAVVD